MTWSEEFPRVFVGRGAKRKGNRYYAVVYEGFVFAFGAYQHLGGGGALYVRIHEFFCVEYHWIGLMRLVVLRRKYLHRMQRRPERVSRPLADACGRLRRSDQSLGSDRRKREARDS